MRSLVWGLALGLVLAPVAGAQSLGDAAAREKAKREKRGKATPAPSYTDADLKDPNKPAADKDKERDPNLPAPANVSNVGAGEGSTRRVRPNAPEATTNAGAPSVSASDEAVWRSRAQQHREAVRNAEKAIQEAQDRLNALMSDLDVTNTADPNRLQTIEARKAEARASLDTARLNLAEAQKALQDLEEEARRSSVPPGWLREP
jgi:DNA repair exonuclease SbcCD ATPase subunit